MSSHEEFQKHARTTARNQVTLISRSTSSSDVSLIHQCVIHTVETLGMDSSDAEQLFLLWRDADNLGVSDEDKLTKFKIILVMNFGRTTALTLLNKVTKRLGEIQPRNLISDSLDSQSPITPAITQSNTTSRNENSSAESRPLSAPAVPLPNSNSTTTLLNNRLESRPLSAPAVPLPNSYNNTTLLSNRLESRPLPAPTVPLPNSNNQNIAYEDCVDLTRLIDYSLNVAFKQKELNFLEMRLMQNLWQDIDRQQITANEKLKKFNELLRANFHFKGILIFDKIKYAKNELIRKRKQYEDNKKKLYLQHQQRQNQLNKPDNNNPIKNTIHQNQHHNVNQKPGNSTFYRNCRQLLGPINPVVFTETQRFVFPADTISNNTSNVNSISRKRKLSSDRVVTVGGTPVNTLSSNSFPGSTYQIVKSGCSEARDVIDLCDSDN